MMCKYQRETLDVIVKASKEGKDITAYVNIYDSTLPNNKFVPKIRDDAWKIAYDIIQEDYSKRGEK